MTAILLTGIGELVTNDRSLGDGSPLGLLRDAALVAEHGRVRWVGPRAQAPAARSCPGSSTRTRTWSSPGTGPRSSPPG